MNDVEERGMSMSVTTPERLLTVPEVAERLQVPQSWLYYATKRGVFPHVKVGRYIRFSEAQIQEWIESGGQGAAD